MSSWITHAFLIRSVSYGSADGGRFLVADLLRGPILVLVIVILLRNVVSLFRANFSPAFLSDSSAPLTMNINLLKFTRSSTSVAQNFSMLPV